MIRSAPKPTLFPYTTLFRSRLATGVIREDEGILGRVVIGDAVRLLTDGRRIIQLDRDGTVPAPIPLEGVGEEDRKSTRLNSSHSQISYAVFCLKKKKS